MNQIDSINPLNSKIEKPTAVSKLYFKLDITGSATNSEFHLLLHGGENEYDHFRLKQISTKDQTTMFFDPEKEISPNDLQILISSYRIIHSSSGKLVSHTLIIK